MKRSGKDFLFSPPEWQTALCLPDDPHKSLVSRMGDLLYGYRQGPREFDTRIRVEVVEGAVWQGQELHAPRIPLVRTTRSAPGFEVEEESFSVASPDRRDVMLVRVRNLGTATHTLQPRLVVDTVHPVKCAGTCLVINGQDEVSCSLALGEAEGNAWKLAPLILDGGQECVVAVSVGIGKATGKAIALQEATALRDRMIVYWERETGLPYGRIAVPDPMIQALLDSSVRNIWQAREIKDGLPAFQVGPTIYRSLWIVDGAFLLETATMLGAGDQARSGVAYELKHQKDDGRIQVMRDKFGFWKENGLVIWTCVRHAQLTQDPAWLEDIWPKLQRIANFIRVLRTDDPLPGTDDVIERLPHTEQDAGLMPKGITDGGIHSGVEYTNNYWNLTGLRAFIAAAHWLGRHDEANLWQAEYDDFMAVLRRAAARDMKTDPHGNRYLPIRMDGEDLPQRAQWAFCHAVYPGQLFDQADPLVAGNLAMLEATEREGMVYGTGWDATGIWNYFASFYAHAWLWQGRGQKAAQQLYAFAAHAAPTLVWREEQSLQGATFKQVGDMPHNWASAEFIRLAIHLVALDRGDELHLFEGLPEAWTRPGMRIALDGVATIFGSLRCSLEISSDGKTARLSLDALRETTCTKVVVHGVGWGEIGLLELAPGQAHQIDLPLTSASLRNP